jgi:hypothetical protein
MKDLDESLKAFMTALEGATKGLELVLPEAHTYLLTGNDLEYSGTITQVSSATRDTYCSRPYYAHKGTADERVYSEEVKRAVKVALNRAYIAAALPPLRGVVSGAAVLEALWKAMRNLKVQDRRKAEKNIPLEWPSLEGLQLYSFFTQEFAATVGGR